MHWLSPKIGFVLLLGGLLFLVTPILAQGNNPPVGDCGLPDGGNIVSHVGNYDLTSDCVGSNIPVITNGADVSIFSFGFCFRMAINDGTLYVFDANNDLTTYTSGTVTNCPDRYGWSLPPDCFQLLGAIGLLCRDSGPVSSINVYGITPQSEGVHLLRVDQPQVDVTAPGNVVACSSDGRLRVRYGQDGHITFSMGPNYKGKVHHVILENNLHGAVIGTHVTYDGLPCAPDGDDVVFIVADITPQPARVDGSLIHVVQPYETVFSIALAYETDMEVIIHRNQLRNGGQLIFPGQELVIREPVLIPIETVAAKTAVTSTSTTSPVDHCLVPPVETGPVIHVVRAGETTIDIAESYGVSRDEIVAYNGLSHRGRYIFAGQELLVRLALSAEELAELETNHQTTAGCYPTLQ